MNIPLFKNTFFLEIEINATSLYSLFLVQVGGTKVTINFFSRTIYYSKINSSYITHYIINNYYALTFTTMFLNRAGATPCDKCIT